MMRVRTMENVGGAKKLFFVKSCVPFDKAGCPGIEGHLVMLSEGEDRARAKGERCYYSLVRHEEGTSFGELPKTMGEIPLLHSKEDYRRIRNYLLEKLKAAEKP